MTLHQDFYEAYLAALAGEESIIDKRKTNFMLTGWKMFLFNSVIAVAAVAQAANWVEIIPPQYVAPVVAAIGMINIMLRSYTKTPIFHSEPIKQ